MQDRVVLLGAETQSGRAVAKKLRAEQYCCELLRSDAGIAAIKALSPSGVIIAGEFSEGAKVPDAEMLALGLPVLALGAPARSLLGGIASASGGTVLKESVLQVYFKESRLFAQVASGERWIGEAEAFTLDAPYEVIADGDTVPVAFADEEKRIYLLQFQIERNDPDGTEMLKAFAADICGCTPWWTQEAALAECEAIIRDGVGEREAVCAMSGGLDSTVTAMLAHKVLGERAHFVFVDTGLLRANEAEENCRFFKEELGLEVLCVDASEAVLTRLEGVADMGRKRAVVEAEIHRAIDGAGEWQQAAFVKGTNFGDSLVPGAEGVENVRAVEPLCRLFKEDIRMVGQMLGLPETLLTRKPFPGMGLAARIRGVVTGERIAALRRADAIFSMEIEEAGLDKRLDRFFALLDETGENKVLILRAMQGTEPSMTVARLPYDLIERTVDQIREQMPHLDRVLYDVTPGIAEWPK